MILRRIELCSHVHRPCKAHARSSLTDAKLTPREKLRSHVLIANSLLRISIQAGAGIVDSLSWTYVPPVCVGHLELSLTFLSRLRNRFPDDHRLAPMPAYNKELVNEHAYGQ